MIWSVHVASNAVRSGYSCQCSLVICLFGEFDVEIAVGLTGDRDRPHDADHTSGLRAHCARPVGAQHTFPHAMAARRREGLA